MTRSAFIKRMAFAAAACAFIDVPLPKVTRQGSTASHLADISGLVREVFTGRVLPAVPWESVTVQLLEEDRARPDAVLYVGLP